MSAAIKQANALSAHLDTLTDSQARPVRRHLRYAESNRWTIKSIPLDDLRKMRRDCGSKATALILDCSEADVAGRLGIEAKAKAQRKIDSVTEQMQTGRKVLDLMGALKDALSPAPASLPKAPAKRGAIRSIGSPPAKPTEPEPAPRIEGAPLPADAHLAVRLDSLSPGQRIKTPNAPRENLAGEEATLIRIGIGSASVRLGGVRRKMKAKGAGFDASGAPIDKDVEFDAPGKLVSWALSTMVVPFD